MDDVDGFLTGAMVVAALIGLGLVATVIVGIIMGCEEDQ
jgi:hypothetical protein